MAAGRGAAAAPSGGARFGADVAAAWGRLAPRERLGAGLAIALVVLLLLWMAAIQPAWRTLRTAPAQIDALDTQLQQMQRLAAESRELRGTAPVTLAQATTALKSASDRLGSRATLSVVGDRATLTLRGATGPELLSWLGEARSAARVRPIEAQLNKGSSGYEGTVVLLLGGGAS